MNNIDRDSVTAKLHICLLTKSAHQLICSTEKTVATTVVLGRKGDRYILGVIELEESDGAGRNPRQPGMQETAYSGCEFHELCIWLLRVVKKHLMLCN